MSSFDVSFSVTPEQLEEEFHFLESQFVDNVPGVWIMDSWRPGPTLGITINTHGNEPSGLAAFWYLRHQFPSEYKLSTGRVFIVLNNIEATRKYFKALRIKDDKERDDAKKKARQCSEVNFNRLPKETMMLASDTRYEITRAQQIHPIWNRFTAAIDIHSMGSAKAMSAIIVCGELHKDLIAGFPIEDVMTNILNVQINQPAVSFYSSDRNIPIMGIEAGSHEDNSSFVCAVSCVLCLMRNLGLIKSEPRDSAQRHTEYRIVDSLMFPFRNYRLVKVFGHKEVVAKNQLLAAGADGTELYAPLDGHVMMPPPDETTVKNIKEEVMFFSLPAKKMSF